MSTYDLATPGIQANVIAVGLTSGDSDSLLPNLYPEEFLSAVGMLFKNHLKQIDLTEAPRKIASLTFTATGYVLVASLSAMIRNLYGANTSVDILVRDSLENNVMIKVHLAGFMDQPQGDVGMITGQYIVTTGQGVDKFAAEVFDV